MWKDDEFLDEIEQEEDTGDTLEVLDLNNIREEEEASDDEFDATLDHPEYEDDMQQEEDFPEEEEESSDQVAVVQNKFIAFIQELMSWVIPILIAVLAALILKSFVIINANVPSGSMLNTIHEDDNLFGFRLAYQFSEPERGDIIIFYYPDDESKKFIKRIIGLPGDKVIIQDAKIYINDSEEPLEEDYLPEEWTIANGPYEFNVPEDSYLVLGDNRNDSLDARFWENTYVSKDKIIGKAWCIYYPFNHMRFLD